MKTYFNFINESNDNDDFKIGDSVYVHGTVDDKQFIGSKDIIQDISARSVITTNRNEKGKCADYRYTGKIYLLRSSNWWVSPYNLSKKEIELKRNYSDIDPYGEEEVEEEITEAKKLKGEYVSLVKTGQNEGSIYYYMRCNVDDEINRNNVIDLINDNISKKLVFTNKKDTTPRNIKKERVINGAYWKKNSNLHDRQHLLPRRTYEKWELYLIGTKKDYKVNILRDIGYYREYRRTISPMDPYGEEIWD